MNILTSSLAFYSYNRNYKWYEARNLLIEAIYLPGSLNVVADAESCALPQEGDWRLSAVVFALISDQRPVNIDMFAAACNTQLPRFFSRNPQPGAEAVDAF